MNSTNIVKINVDCLYYVEGHQKKGCMFINLVLLQQQTTYRNIQTKNDLELNSYLNPIF